MNFRSLPLSTSKKRHRPASAPLPFVRGSPVRTDCVGASPLGDSPLGRSKGVERRPLRFPAKASQNLLPELRFSGSERWRSFLERSSAPPTRATKVFASGNLRVREHGLEQVSLDSCLLLTSLSSPLLKAQPVPRLTKGTVVRASPRARLRLRGKFPTLSSFI